MKEKFSAQAQAALSEFLKACMSDEPMTREKILLKKAKYPFMRNFSDEQFRVGCSPLNVRAMLYRNMSDIYFEADVKPDKIAQMISGLPIDERFAVLKAIDLKVEEYEKDLEIMTAEDQGDQARKFVRCLEDSVVADKAEEIGCILSTLPYEVADNLFNYICDCAKKKSA